MLKMSVDGGEASDDRMGLYLGGSCSHAVGEDATAGTDNAISRCRKPTTNVRTTLSKG